MEIRFRKRHDHRLHDDPAFEAWLQTLCERDPAPLPLDTELPVASGRALRGLLLNAPHVVPACATPTFEYVARHHSMMRLWSVYHACVKGDPGARWEIAHQVNGLMTNYRGLSLSATGLVALLYVLVSVDHHWMMNPASKDAVRRAISDMAHHLCTTIAELRRRDLALDPIRYTFIDMADETVVCILNRATLAAYLRDGGEWADLTARIETGVSTYPKLSHAVFLD